MKRAEQDADDGVIAAATVGGGILDPGMDQVLREFRSLETVAAKAAFADSWVRQTSHQLERTWPVFYELLKIVQDQALFSKPEYLSDHVTYPSFDAYFEAVARKPFQVWVNLEQTYQFVHEFAPNLFGKNLDEVQEALKVAKIVQIAHEVKGTTPGRPWKTEPKSDSIPEYRRKKDGTAYVNLSHGVQRRLGVYGTPESIARYEEIIRLTFGVRPPQGDVGNQEDGKDDRPRNCWVPAITGAVNQSGTIPNTLNKIAKKVAEGSEPAKKVLDEVKSGKRRDITQAGRDAGVRPRERIHIEKNPESAAKTLLRHFDRNGQELIVSFLIDSLSAEDVASILRLRFSGEELAHLAELILS